MKCESLIDALGRCDSIRCTTSVSTRVVNLRVAMPCSCLRGMFGDMGLRGMFGEMDDLFTSVP